MAKLLAFWSGLTLSGAARIEVHEFRNQRTNATKATGQCVFKTHLIDQLNPTGEALRLPVNSCQPSPTGAPLTIGSMMVRPFPDWRQESGRNEWGQDCFHQADLSGRNVCSEGNCNVYIEYYRDENCGSGGGSSFDCVVGDPAARGCVGDFEEEAAPVTQPPPRCHVGDHVVCSDGQSQCSGNQCCSDGSVCPSADDDFTGCPQGKTVDCTHQQTQGCEACSGAESDCCVETKSFPPETAAIRCINPAIDVCSDGFVCPLSKPSICRQYTCMNPTGDATCFNPETHACITPRYGLCEANQVCAIGSVVCGGACHDENSGVCCGRTWHRTEERKQCCQGSCQRSTCQTWACNADQECVRYGETGFSNDDLSRNCRSSNRGVELDIWR